MIVKVQTGLGSFNTEIKCKEVDEVIQRIKEYCEINMKSLSFIDSDDQNQIHVVPTKILKESIFTIKCKGKE